MLLYSWWLFDQISGPHIVCCQKFDNIYVKYNSIIVHFSNRRLKVAEKHIWSVRNSIQVWKVHDSSVPSNCGEENKMAGYFGSKPQQRAAASWVEYIPSKNNWISKRNSTYFSTNTSVEVVWQITVKIEKFQKLKIGVNFFWVVSKWHVLQFY